MTKQPAAILPTKKRLPKKRMSSYSHAIYGPPGIGKSTWASTWRAPIFVATEPGTAALEAADIEVRSWEDYLVALDAIEREDHPWETVVIDTVDLLNHFCRSSVCSTLGISHPSEGLFAKGWDLLKDRWTEGIHRAARLTRADGRRMCSVFICHEKRAPLTENRDGVVVDTGRTLVTTNLPGSARGILHSAVDFLYHVEFADEGDEALGIQRGDRVIRTQPAELPHSRIEAKGRGMLDRRLPDVLPLDFRALAGAFHTTFGEGERK